MKPFIILQHPTWNGKGFDLLAHKDFINNKKLLEIKDNGYVVQCKHAENFIKKHKNYVYIWSEDNAHIPCFNWIEKWILEKEKEKDFEIIIDEDALQENKNG